MTGALSGPGIGLSPPQNYYPSQLLNAAQDPSSNRQALAPGESFVVPAGDFFVQLGGYLVIQHLDPVTNAWTMGSGASHTRGQVFVKSDGYNVRVANLTGCVVGAVITNAGSAYVQATTTITAVSAALSGAAPTLVPIIGGALGTIATFTLAIPGVGGGFGVPPIVMIPPPPPAANNPNGVGGTPASAYALITSGTVSGISITNPGSGYPSAPVAVCVPSPFDPNLSTGITNATVSFSLTASGSITGVLVTNNGSPLANGSLASITLSIGGAGSSGSLTAVVMQTIVSASVSGAGVGYGTGEFGITTIGGVPGTGAVANPDQLRLAWFPRQAQLGVTGANTSVSVGSAAVVYDGGLFEGIPTLLVTTSTGAAAPSTVATIAAVMGSRTDIMTLQSAP